MFTACRGRVASPRVISALEINVLEVLSEPRIERGDPRLPWGGLGKRMKETGRGKERHFIHYCESTGTKCDNCILCPGLHLSIVPQLKPMFDSQVSFCQLSELLFSFSVRAWASSLKVFTAKQSSNKHMYVRVIVNFKYFILQFHCVLCIDRS